MKNLLFTLIVLITMASTFANDNIFEKTYELQGITNLTDQAMITSPNGDDYFFGIENNQIIGKYRASNSSVFTDYIPDFSHHNFDKIKEVETLSFDNQVKILAVVAEDDGEDLIFIMSFNKEDTIVFRESFILRPDNSGLISNLTIFKDSINDPVLMYNRDGKICLVRFNKAYTRLYHMSLELKRDLEEEVYSEEIVLPINGVIEKSYISNYILDDLDNFLYVFIIDNNGQNELWMLNICGYDYKTLKITDLNQVQSNSLTQEVDNENIILKIDDSISTIYYSINPEDFKFELMQKDDLSAPELGFYFSGKEVRKGIYYKSDSVGYYYNNNKKNIIPDFSEMSDTVFYANDIDNVIYDRIEEIEEKSIDDNFLYIDRYLFIVSKDVSSINIKAFYFYFEDGFTKIDSKTFKNNQKNIRKLLFEDEYLKFGETSIYYSLFKNFLVESSIKPTNFNNYTLYKIDDIYALLQKDDSL